MQSDTSGVSKGGNNARIAMIFLLVLSAVTSAIGQEGQTRPASAPASRPGESNTYFLIPIKGTIGREVTAKGMRISLDRAAALKATVVVLEIDTPGGTVPEAERIVDLMMERKDLRCVALVHKALSAGAAVALTCREIYMTENATLGAAVSYHVGEDGRPMVLPRDVAEKFQSAWRAVCRKAAEFGGHPTLLAEAMADPDFALTSRRTEGRLDFERNGKGEVVKAKGRILTLTAREAVSVGLAKGIVSDVMELGEKVGQRDWRQLPKETAIPPTMAEVKLGPGLPTPNDCARAIYQEVNALNLLESTVTAPQGQAGYASWRTWLGKELPKGRWISGAVTLIEAGGDERILKITPEGKTLHEYGIKVYAYAGTKERVLVSAWVHNSFAEDLARLPKGSELLLEGKLSDVYLRFSSFASGRVPCMELDTCRLIKAPPVAVPTTKPIPSTSSATAPGDRAVGLLRLAEMYRANGMPAKAQEIFRSVIAEYPDTKAADDARRAMKSIDEEMKGTTK